MMYLHGYDTFSVLKVNLRIGLKPGKSGSINSPHTKFRPKKKKTEDEQEEEKNAFLKWTYHNKHQRNQILIKNIVMSL